MKKLLFILFLGIFSCTQSGKVNVEGTLETKDSLSLDTTYVDTLVFDGLIKRGASTLNRFRPDIRTYSLFSGGTYSQFIVYGNATTIDYTLIKAGVYRQAGAEFPWISEYNIKILDESLLIADEYNALIQSNNPGKTYNFNK